MPRCLGTIWSVLAVPTQDPAEPSNPLSVIFKDFRWTSRPECGRVLHVALRQLLLCFNALTQPVVLAVVNWDRGTYHDVTPPTSPDIRVHTTASPHPAADRRCVCHLSAVLADWTGYGLPQQPRQPPYCSINSASAKTLDRYFIAYNNDQNPTLRGCSRLSRAMNAS